MVLVAPVPAAERARTVRLRPRNQRRWLVWGIVVALLAALAAVLASGRTSSPSYRTASVERADVDATLDGLGTIQPINQANLSFPVAGNVGSVSAVVGQQVAVGETLAQLDTTALDAQVASAQSAVAAAQARLASDASNQTSGTATAAVAPAAFTTDITGPSDPTAAARDLVTTQQAELIADQHHAVLELATEQHDLKTETDLCQSPLRDGGAAPGSPKLDTHSSLSSVTSGTAALPAAKPLNADGCQTELQTVLADQVAVEHDQQAVSTDLSALHGAVDQLVASTRTSAQPLQPASAPRTSANTTHQLAVRAVRSDHQRAVPARPPVQPDHRQAERPGPRHPVSRPQPSSSPRTRLPSTQPRRSSPKRNRPTTRSSCVARSMAPSDR